MENSIASGADTCAKMELRARLQADPIVDQVQRIQTFIGRRSKE